MKLLNIFTVIVSVVVVAQCHPDFVNFKATFGKSYKDDLEENMRKNVFLKNLEMINKHNEKFNRGESTFSVAVNHLADLELHEIIGSCLRVNSTTSAPQENADFKEAELKDLPEEVDWREKNLVTRVKNQGDCGSCYAFSVTGGIESHWAIKTKYLIPLSEQDIIDCTESAGNQGCGGGYIDKTVQFIAKRGGIATEKSYPYKAIVGKCNYNRKNSEVSIRGIKKLPNGDEKALQAAVAYVGPISVAIDATILFQFYFAGVFYDPFCSSSSNKLNHAVLVVGYGHTPHLKLDYWLVKNSWGTMWGKQGYIKMARNMKNMCGISTDASYPLV